MATLTPTVEQIATSRQYLHAAKRIADDHQVQTRIGDGALEVRLDGCEQPHLIITVGVESNGRASMEITRIDSTTSQTPVVLGLIDADGEPNPEWGHTLKQIIINHGGAQRR